jgi:hypothetical protein
MIRRAVLSAVVVCLGLAGARADDAAQWKEYASDEGRFTVKMPGTPKKSKTPIDAPGGKTLDQHQFLIDKGNLAYLVAYQDDPNLKNVNEETAQKVLDAARDAVPKALDGKLLDTRKIKLDDKHLGVEFRVEVASIKGVYRSRIYVVGERIYQITVVGPKEVTSSKESDAYLDSLKLTK